MNILILNHNISGTGTFLRCYGFGRELANLGHSITILTTSKTHRFRINIIQGDNLEIVEFPDLLFGKLRNGFCPYNTLRRILFLRNMRFDIVHAFDSRPVVIFPALYISKVKGIPLVMDWADWWGRGGTISERSGKLFRYTLGYVETFFEEKFRKYADSATVISSTLFDRLLKLGFDQEKVLLVNQGCYVHGTKLFDKDKCRVKLGLEKDQFLVGYLGVLLPADAQLLFNTYKLLRSKLNNVRLLLIGNTKINLSRFTSATDSVFSTGVISFEYLHYYLGACDLMILPLVNNTANNGRWPSKFNDYLSAGKAIISTAISDLGEIFFNYNVGLLANDDPDDFSDAIVRVLKDDNLRKKMGNNARKYAEHHLDWKILTKKLENFYIQTMDMK